MNNVVPFPQQPSAAEKAGISNTRPTTVTRAVYTVAETAEILSLSLGATYALVRSGEIPALKLGGRWIIPKGRLHRWLNDLPEASTEDVATAVQSPSAKSRLTRDRSR